MDIAQDQNVPQSLAVRYLRTNEQMTQFYADLTTDYNPIHLEPAFAEKTSFGAPIIHGTLGLNLLINAIEETFGDTNVDIQIDVRFIRPIHVGTTIRAGGTLKDSTPLSYAIFVETEAGERAVEGTCTISHFPATP
jgi:3-hydroxybutyryl-CoA dehydratase